jgi:hypothetical protein
LLTCTKEYSFEGGLPVSQPIVPLETPNEIITSCSIYINDESEVRWIYPEVITKYHPATYWIFDSVKMNGSHQYDRTYDLKNYIQLSDYKIGDTFYVRYEIRWRFSPAEFVQEDTLVY